MTFRFAGPITMNNAAASLAACVAAIDGGDPDFALDSLAHSDSSAVAVLVSARRHAQAKGKTLRLTDMPDTVRDLARLYGVDALIDDRASTTVSIHR